jgi:hypothetical protein
MAKLWTQEKGQLLEGIWRWESQTKRQSTSNFLGSETVVYNTVMMDACHTFVKIHRMYDMVNPNVAIKFS